MSSPRRKGKVPNPDWGQQCHVSPLLAKMAYRPCLSPTANLCGDSLRLFVQSPRCASVRFRPLRYLVSSDRVLLAEVCLAWIATDRKTNGNLLSHSVVGGRDAPCLRLDLRLVLGGSRQLDCLCHFRSPGVPCESAPLVRPKNRFGVKVAVPKSGAMVSERQGASRVDLDS